MDPADLQRSYAWRDHVSGHILGYVKLVEIDIFGETRWASRHPDGEPVQEPDPSRAPRSPEADPPMRDQTVIISIERVAWLVDHGWWVPGAPGDEV